MAKSIMTFILLCVFLVSELTARPTPIPIQFSIPTCKMVDTVPKKDRDFAFIIPGQPATYIYQDEASYYAAYQRSYFAVTTKKAGWDCLRHYEILANGCIPYFVDLDKCPEKTMFQLPKELIKQAMSLPGVSYLSIDHVLFDKKKYEGLLVKILDHTRKHLTSKAMAAYVLEKAGYGGSGKILFLSGSLYPDYLRCLTLTGLKELLGSRVVDVPKVEHVYKSYPHDVRQLYGKGMTYTKVVDDLPVDRNNIEQRIANKEFDLVIYGSVHRGLPFYDLVFAVYPSSKIIYLCGEDIHRCPFVNRLENLFLREF